MRSLLRRTLPGRPSQPRTTASPEAPFVAKRAFGLPLSIDRNVSLARDLGPALGLCAHHVCELLWRHGFGFGALIVEERNEFGRGQHLADLRVERVDNICRQPGGCGD